LRNCRSIVVIVVLDVLVDINCYSRLVITIANDLLGLVLAWVGCRDLTISFYNQAGL